VGGLVIIINEKLIFKTVLFSFKDVFFHFSELRQWYVHEQCVILFQLREKVELLEQSLGHAVREFEVEQGALAAKTNDEMEWSRLEVAKLQRIIELKTKEMNKVKKLARNILDQRTEVERFFLDALDHVKKEVIAHR